MKEKKQFAMWDDEEQERKVRGEILHKIKEKNIRESEQKT